MQFLECGDIIRIRKIPLRSGALEIVSSHDIHILNQLQCETFIIDQSFELECLHIYIDGNSFTITNHDFIFLLKLVNEYYVSTIEYQIDYDHIYQNLYKIVPINDVTQIIANYNEVLPNQFCKCVFLIKIMVQFTKFFCFDHSYHIHYHT